MSRPACSARVGNLPALLTAVAAIACTPVPPPAVDRDEPAAAGRQSDLFAYDPDTRPLQIGEVVTDLSLIDVAGRPMPLVELRGQALVLTVFTAVEARDMLRTATDDPSSPAPRPAPGSAERHGGEILARFAELQTSLTPALAGDVRLIAVLLDATPQAGELLRTLQGAAPFTLARTPPQAAAGTATAFGVALWEAAGGEARQTYNVLVIDRRGRLADQFPGLDAWDVRDVVAAISEAAGRN